MNQNLSQYKIFYEVAKAGNISKAAKELYISQPAISKAISKLEDSLSTVLFTRNSRGVQLTEEGQILFEHTSSAFEQLNAGELELKRVREFNMGQIRIGVSNTLCRFIMVSYLKNFIEQYPHIKISIDSQSTTHWNSKKSIWVWWQNQGPPRGWYFSRLWISRTFSLLLPLIWRTSV